MAEKAFNKTILFCAKLFFVFAVFISSARAQNLAATLDKLLGYYHRQITFLDVGCCSTELIINVLKRKQVAVVFCPESARCRELIEQEINRRTLILFDRQGNQADIDDLVSCEHFDIAVVPAGLMSSKQEKMLADFVVIVPQKGSIKGAVQVVVNNAYRNLARRNIFWQRKLADKRYTVTSLPESIFLIKKELRTGIELRQPWIAGINFLTFAALKGIYPSGEIMENEIARLELVKHPDWSPANMVVTGANLVMIDFQDTALHVLWSAERAGRRAIGARIILHGRTREEKLAAYCQYLG